MIVGGIADGEIGISIAGIGTRLENLVNVTGDTLSVGAGWYAAGIDLHFLAS